VISNICTSISKFTNIMVTSGILNYNSKPKRDVQHKAEKCSDFVSDALNRTLRNN